MIETIRLKHYKAFEDTGDIRLAPVTLILGRNNSGKSALLKSLSFICEAIAKGKDSSLKLSPRNGVVMGSSFQDLFHNRQFTDLSFGLRFDGVEYEINLISNKGAVVPSGYVIKSADHENSAQSSTLSEDVNGLFPTKEQDSIGGLEDMMRFEVYHIGPLRIESPRIIERSKASRLNFVGHHGENTYSILLDSMLGDEELIFKVSRWFRDNMGVSVGFEAIDTELTNFRPYVERDGIKINMADSGLGISQLLPIVTQSFLPGKDTVICVEQPALHLHPSAHESVLDRLADSALETGARYVVESHSKNLLLALRLRVATAENGFGPDAAAVYFVESSEPPSVVKEIKIRQNGKLSYWPTGVFGEDVELLDRILDR